MKTSEIIVLTISAAALIVATVHSTLPNGEGDGNQARFFSNSNCQPFNRTFGKKTWIKIKCTLITLSLLTIVN